MVHALASLRNYIVPLSPFQISLGGVGLSSDETDCEYECVSNQFRCLDGSSCVPKSWVCDNTPDCRDGSDEEQCNQQVRIETRFNLLNVNVFITLTLKYLKMSDSM